MKTFFDIDEDKSVAKFAPVDKGSVIIAWVKKNVGNIPFTVHESRDGKVCLEYDDANVSETQLIALKNFVKSL